MEPAQPSDPSPIGVFRRVRSSLYSGPSASPAKQLLYLRVGSTAVTRVAVQVTR